MTNKYFVGVDPGKSPAICVLDGRGQIVHNRLLKHKTDFPYLDWMMFLNTLERELFLEECDLYMTVELPHSVRMASAKANFQFGLSVGACIQGVQFVQTPDLVSPKEWQKKVWKNGDKVKGDSKATSLAAAKRILGSAWNDENFLPTTRSKVVNHNLIDSYLIAMYGYLKNNNGL